MTKILHAKVEAGEKLLASDILDLTFFPMGSILMMDGGWTDGRGGWYICDGRNTPHGKTPDLKDRFIRGGTSSGDSGGGTTTLASANLPSHNHALGGLTITGGDHSHGNGTLAASSGSANHSHGNGTLDVSITGGAHGHSINDPGHTHAIKLSHEEKNDQQTPTQSNNAHEATGYTESAKTGITINNNTSHNHTVTLSGTIGYDDASHGHSMSGAIASAGHTHDISGGTIGNTGEGAAFDVVPAYYTVIYIKKMA
ncbi:MAG: hypothetical protein LBJ25_08400 [Candidatus Margulisbacteria bacterium]|jgi:hypothetical protein|nr:hypothetical protein [Candidatus Margulisiibacteriota bacterium]